MKTKHMFLAALVSVSTFAAVPAQAEDLGLQLDIGGKVGTSTANIGMGWGGALSYRLPQSPFSLSLGAQFYGMNDLPSGATGSVVDMPIQVRYNFASDLMPGDFQPYGYVGNDVRFLSSSFGGANFGRTEALNPTFGLGATYFFTQNFGLHGAVGGRVAIDNGVATPQFVTHVGTSFRF